MYLEINNDDYMQLSGSDSNVNIYKDTTISGNLNAAGRIVIDGSHLNVQTKSSTSSETLALDQSMSSEFGSDSHGINAYGRQGGNSHLMFYNGRSGSVCNVLIDGNLDFGVGAASSIVKAHVNHEGSTGHIRMEAKWGKQAFLIFDTTFGSGCILVEVK